MKKLLIAMSAAAMFSLCAKADTTPTLLGSMDFETGYSAGAPIATGSVDPSNLDPNPNQLVFWAGDNGESEIVEADNNKYLKVDTTAELTRKTAELTASENPVDPVSITNADVTVSAKVQFTAADEAPPVDTASGDKLIVWMRAAAEAEGTQGEEGYTPAVSAAVMVTDKTGVHVLTNIADEAVESFTAAWHTLAIKAVKAGTEQQPTAAFTVTLDGNDYGPFTSLVTGGDYCQTISSIGFKGTGAVDDIVFAKTAAEEPIPVTLSATCNDTEIQVMIMDESGADEIEEANVGEKILVIVQAGSGDSVSCEDLSFTYIPYVEGQGGWNAWVAEYTLTAADGEDGSKAFAITVTSGGQGGDDPEIVVPGGSDVEAVIAAATSATGIEIANVTAANQVSIDNVNHEITVGETTVSIPAFYTASFDFGEDPTKIVLTLNDAALTTAGTMVEVSVDTAFGLKVSASNEKLYYGLSSCATVNGTYAAPAKAGFTQGTGNALTLSAAKGVGSARFYKLYVTDVLPNE